MGSKNLLEKAGIDIVSTEESMKDRDDLVGKVATPEIVKPQLFIRKGDKIEAVRAGLVPAAYVDCEFSIEKIKENQKKQANVSKRKFKVKNFDNYKDVTTGIISTIISNMIPNQSYIIGAPNGFGKTSFVNTCIMRLHAQGRMCAPYISLTDLAQVKVANEKRLIEGIGARMVYGENSELYRDTSYEDYMDVVYENFDSAMYTKKPINLIDRYSWSEYMNCDVLFCYFTDVSSKVLESEMFKTAITVRGAKGLPTIAMISTSLLPYKKDTYLSEYVWNEILSYDDTPSCDRVKHVSCYKDYYTPLEAINKES